MSTDNVAHGYYEDGYNTAIDAVIELIKINRQDEDLSWLVRKILKLKI